MVKEVQRPAIGRAGRRATGLVLRCARGQQHQPHETAHRLGLAGSAAVSAARYRVKQQQVQAGNYALSHPSSDAERHRQDQVTSCHRFDSTDIDFALMAADKYHSLVQETTFSSTR